MPPQRESNGKGEGEGEGEGEHEGGARGQGGKGVSQHENCGVPSVDSSVHAWYHNARAHQQLVVLITYKIRRCFHAAHV